MPTGPRSSRSCCRCGGPATIIGGDSIWEPGESGRTLAACRQGTCRSLRSGAARGKAVGRPSIERRTTGRRLGKPLAGADCRAGFVAAPAMCVPRSRAAVICCSALGHVSFAFLRR
jgi:hypothetical protein